MIWVWRCLKGSGRRSVTAGVFRQKGCARHLYGFLRRRPITKPTAAPSRRLPSGLFDELAPLHGLSRRDRTLLSLAAIVHDIGWTFGQAGHQKKSAELVFSCADLPVPVREQGIIALVAGLHGGNAPPGGFFFLLPPADRRRVRILASLLRVADGLDYLHAGSVTGIHCTIRETDVHCTLTCTSDTATEKARALKKSDLFRDVFGKTLVIA